MVPLPVVNPNDFGGCVRLYNDVVSYAELDRDGSDELMNLWELLGLRGGCKVVFCKPVDGKLYA